MKRFRLWFALAFLAATPFWTSLAQAEEGSNSPTLSPTSFTFAATTGSTTTAHQTLTVSANSTVTFSASASGSSSGHTWLSVSPSGTLSTPHTLTVSTNPSGLAAGTYSGNVYIHVGDNTQRVPVTLKISATTKTFTVSPASLSFSASVGGASPAAQSLSLTASPNTTFTVSVSGGSWLKVSSTTGTTPATITVSSSVTGLAAGVLSGTVTLTANGITRSIPVTFTVNSSSAFNVSPSSISFSAAVGGTSPAMQSLSVSASPNTTFTATVSGASWLKLSAATGTTPATLTVSSSVTGLAAGVFTGTISLTGNGITRSVPVTFTVSSASSASGSFKLIGWNDLGMHCFDGKDYSVFAVLPPYNTIHAHLVNTAGSLVTAPGSYKITYKAITDPLTSTLNTTSIGKTNFWNYVTQLGLGASVPDVGLTGNAMPGSANTPQPMSFSTADNTWMASGIPMTPFADNGTTNYFPMMRLTATDTSGAVLATTDIVVPTSDEMSCITCHASNSNTAAKPNAGWVNDSADPARDTKLNILRKHDDRFQSLALFQSAATQVGYNPAGLEATVATKPVLCYQCHSSNALAMNGVTGIKSMTSAVHGLHASQIDPATGVSMDSDTTRAGCYSCHPGPRTQCLRGAMANQLTSTGSKAIECQSCHGNLTALATPTRSGWLNEPTCQACHTGLASASNTNLAYTSVFSSGTTMRTPADNTFATNVNMPASGLSMYRFSSGHGGMQCEACHGSTHAEYPTSIANDNVQSISLQGHVGMLSECSTCHATVPNTTNGGPHGLHPIGTSWVNAHQDVADRSGAASCQGCHGTDYRGTILSRVLTTRTLAGKTFTKGTMIGCYSCHNGPNGG